MKEFPVGTILKYPLHYFKITWYLQVVPKKVQCTCLGCIFMASGKCSTQNKAILGKCGSTTRTDNGIVFKLIYKKMNTNEIKIEIPKGMVIDLSISDLSKGIIRFIKECPTYDQIDEYLLRNNLEGRLNVSDFRNSDYVRNLVKLFNISLYFNNASAYTNKYRILKGVNGYYVSVTDENGMPYFNSKEDAELVIENFKGILDSIFLYH